MGIERPMNGLEKLAQWVEVSEVKIKLPLAVQLGKANRRQLQGQLHSSSVTTSHHRWVGEGNTNMCSNGCLLPTSLGTVFRMWWEYSEGDWLRIDEKEASTPLSQQLARRRRWASHTQFPHNVSSLHCHDKVISSAWEWVQQGYNPYSRSTQD